MMGETLAERVGVMIGRYMKVVISGSEFKVELVKVLENGQHTFKMIENTFNKAGHPVFLKGDIIKIQNPEVYD